MTPRESIGEWLENTGWKPPIPSELEEIIQQDDIYVFYKGRYRINLYDEYLDILNITALAISVDELIANDDNSVSTKCSVGFPRVAVSYSDPDIFTIIEGIEDLPPSEKKKIARVVNADQLKKDLLTELNAKFKGYVGDAFTENQLDNLRSEIEHVLSMTR